MSHALRIVVAVLALRGLPFAFVLAGARRYPWRLRVTYLSVYAGVAWLASAHADMHPGTLAATYAYFALAAWASWQLAETVRARALMFVWTLGVYLVGPVLCLREGASVAAALGWELALSAYSYHVQAPKGAHRPRFTQCLFFLLVNPTLVYDKRGTQVAAPGLDAKGVLRVATGACALFASAALCDPVHAQLAGRGSLFMLLSGAAWLVGQYLSHSGRASIQLGMMRQLGQVVPERYDYPLAARTPAQFWRRWNTYVGDWVRLLVFRPLALRAARATRARPGLSRGLQAGCALTTFVLIGALHDLHNGLLSGHFELSVTAWFVAAGAAGLLWERAARGLRGVLSGRAHILPERAWSMLARGCVAVAIVTFAALLEKL